MASYKEKLKHPNWQKKRLRILQRDKFTCQKCGDSTMTLHVHHLRYQRGKEPWQYKNADLMTLCEMCHWEIDSIKEWKGSIDLDKWYVFKWKSGGKLIFLFHKYEDIPLATVFSDGVCIERMITDIRWEAAYPLLNTGVGGIDIRKDREKAKNGKKIHRHKQVDTK